MTINQLFNNKPEEEILLNILGCLGIKSFDDTRLFSKLSFTDSIIENMKPHLDVLRMYYIECKRDLYFEGYQPKKIITIIKQCMNLYDYFLDKKEIYNNEIKKKILHYYILKNDMKNEANRRKIKYSNVILYFN